MNLLILVVDDEPDVEILFRQQFRRDLRAGRFTMEFAQSADMALQLIAGAARSVAHSDFVRHQHAGMSGLELLPKAKAAATGRPGHHDHRLWRCRDKAPGVGDGALRRC